MEEVKADLARQGISTEPQDDAYSIEVVHPSISLSFDSSSSKRLVQIVFNDAGFCVDGQPVMGLPLAEAMLPFRVPSYQHTLWSLVSIEEEYRNGQLLPDSKRTRRCSREDKLAFATLWLKGKGVGLVMLYDEVHAIALRRAGEEPKVGAGCLDAKTMEMALDVRPLPPMRSVPIPAKRQDQRMKRPMQPLVTGVCIILALIVFLIPLGMIYRSHHAWSQAKTVTGVVTSTQPEGPFPDEVIVRYRIPEAGEYSVAIPCTYTSARTIQEEVELSYLPNQPEVAMTPLQVRDVRWSLSPWVLFGCLGLSFFLFALPLADRRWRR